MRNFLSGHHKIQHGHEWDIDNHEEKIAQETWRPQVCVAPLWQEFNATLEGHGYRMFEKTRESQKCAAAPIAAQAWATSSELAQKSATSHFLKAEGKTETHEQGINTPGDVLPAESGLSGARRERSPFSAG